MKDRRLFLFDIDGTLLSTGGAGSAAMKAAFAALYGLEDGFRSVEFSGRSDRAIFEDAFAGAGFGESPVSEALQRFKRAYFRRLPGMLESFEGRVLPGVPELLKTLAYDDRTTVSLGTGNFRTSAGIKLQYYGLRPFFRFGGFGDRTGVRAELIAQGIRAANRVVGRHGSVFVIGDTEHDIRAAKANEAIAVGVATGTVSEKELEEAGADIVLPTLEDASAILRRDSQIR